MIIQKVSPRKARIDGFQFPTETKATWGTTVTSTQPPFTCASSLLLTLLNNIIMPTHVDINHLKNGEVNLGVGCDCGNADIRPPSWRFSLTEVWSSAQTRGPPLGLTS